MTANGFSRTFLFSVAALFVAITSVAKASPDCRKEKFQFDQARRLYEADQMLLSAVHFSLLRGADCDGQIASRSWLGYSLALSQLQEKGEALRVADEGLLEARVLPADKNALRMVKTWVQQEPVPGLSTEQRTRWNLWMERADRPLYLSTLEAANLQVSEKTRLADLNLKMNSAPRKSVWVSGIASALLPGAGQAYTGNWQAAGLAFVINAVFFAAMNEFSKNDLHAAAAASGGIFSITYIGNIVSAAQGAQEANRLAQAPAEGELKNLLLPELTF